MASTKLKILYLLDILYEYTDAEHRLTADNLCDLLKKDYSIAAERKSVYRDIEYLNEYGVDVKKTPQGYFLNARKFAIAEIRLLISAVQTAPFITGTKTNLLMKKLTSYLSKYQAESMLNQGNIGSVKYSNEEVYKNIENINLAIAMRKKLSFYYYKKNVNRRDEIQHNGARYIVSPYAMIWVQDKYYLVANVDGHNELTHFRMDRMKGVFIEKVAWRHFSEVSSFKDKFDAAKYASQCVNMFGGKLECVTLKCKNERVNEIFERFGEKIPIRPETGGSFTAFVDVAISNGFYTWIAQFFGDIEILSPKYVRDNYMKLIVETYKRYKGE